MTDSFAGQYRHVIDRIQAARQSGDRPAEQEASRELLEAYGLLATRKIGTVDEQNAYIIARSLGCLPGELRGLGISPDELPLSDRRSIPTPPPAEPSFLDSNVADRFAHIGGPDDEEPEPRYTVADRPQDNIRYRGELQRYAVIDTADGLPVGWYNDPDYADTIADTISRLRTTD